MKYLINLLVLISFVFITFPTFAYVAEDTENADRGKQEKQLEIEKKRDEKKREENKIKYEERKQKVEEKKEEKKEEVRLKKEENVAKRCELINEKIDIAISRYENNKNSVINWNAKVEEYISKVLSRAEEKNLDTTELNSLLVEFNDKVESTSSAYAAYIESLENSKQFSCGESEGEFKEALAASREKLKLVKENFVDVRTFYQTQVRPEIQNILNQLKNDEQE